MFNTRLGLCYGSTWTVLSLSRLGLKSLDAQLDVTADQRDSNVLRGRVQSTRLRSDGSQGWSIPEWIGANVCDC